MANDDETEAQILQMNRRKKFSNEQGQRDKDIKYYLRVGGQRHSTATKSEYSEIVEETSTMIEVRTKKTEEGR